VTDLNRKEPEKPDPGCMAGCGTGSKKKKKGTIKESDQPQIRKDPVEGVELLWQPEIVKSYLSIMAEASNPETLEGSAGAIHNLTACAWRVRQEGVCTDYPVHSNTFYYVCCNMTKTLHSRTFSSLLAFFLSSTQNTWRVFVWKRMLSFCLSYSISKTIENADKNGHLRTRFKFGNL